MTIGHPRKTAMSRVQAQLDGQPQKKLITYKEAHILLTSWGQEKNKNAPFVCRFAWLHP